MVYSNEDLNVMFTYAMYMFIISCFVARGEMEYISSELPSKHSKIVVRDNSTCTCTYFTE